jgi:hypothetical protein
VDTQFQDSDPDDEDKDPDTGMSSGEDPEAEPFGMDTDMGDDDRRRV